MPPQLRGEDAKLPKICKPLASQSLPCRPARLVAASAGISHNWPMRRLAIAIFACFGAAAACSPTQTFNTVEGMRCTATGDEVCSQETGSPRARCDFDGQWHIIESCGAEPCIADPAGLGQHTTRCGGAPTAGKDSAGLSTGGADATKRDPSEFDAGWAGSGDALPTSGAGPDCGAYTCPAKQVCTLGDACEDNSCPTACRHGERCSLGVCVQYCYGSCAASEYCAPAELGDWCKTMGCTAPMDLGAALVATDVDIALPDAASAACAHLAGAQFSLNKALAGAAVAGPALNGSIHDGTETVAVASLPDGSVACLTAQISGACPSGAAACKVMLSKHDNLAVPASGLAPCKARRTANGDNVFKQLPLPLRLGKARLPALVGNAKVTVPADAGSAEVCGYLTKADLQAMLSPLPAGAGVAFQILKAIAPDIDSDGNGTADAYSLHLTLKLRPAELDKWLP